jgi:catechol 2,3-dioxygenase-like lactoylglutathione lyase family enzyme
MTSRGAFFALSVADMKASAAWYVEKLGLAVVMEEAATDHPGVTVLEGGGLIVELIQNPDAMPLAKAAPNVRDRMLVHGLVKAGVIVDSRARKSLLSPVLYSATPPAPRSASRASRTP